MKKLIYSFIFFCFIASNVIAQKYPKPSLHPYKVDIYFDKDNMNGDLFAKEFLTGADKEFCFLKDSICFYDAVFHIDIINLSKHERNYWWVEEKNLVIGKKDNPSKWIPLGNLTFRSVEDNNMVMKLFKKKRN